jgi:hypothetical protein
LAAFVELLLGAVASAVKLTEAITPPADDEVGGGSGREIECARGGECGSLAVNEDEGKEGAPALALAL